MDNCVLGLGYDNCENMMDYAVLCMLICCFVSSIAYMTCKQVCKHIWVIEGSKMGFLGENHVKPVLFF